MWRNTLLEHNNSQWPFKKSKHSTLDSQDFRITHLGVTHYSSTSFSLVNITPPSLIGQVEHPQISDVHCYLPFHFWLQNDLVPCSCSCSWLCHRPPPELHATSKSCLGERAETTRGCESLAWPAAALPAPLGGTALQGTLRASYSEAQQWSTKHLELDVRAFRGCGDICHMIPYQLEDGERNE